MFEYLPEPETPIDDAILPRDDEPYYADDLYDTGNNNGPDLINSLVVSKQHQSDGTGEENDSKDEDEHGKKSNMESRDTDEEDDVKPPSRTG